MKLRPQDADTVIEVLRETVSGQPGLRVMVDASERTANGQWFETFAGVPPIHLQGEVFARFIQNVQQKGITLESLREAGVIGEELIGSSSETGEVKAEVIRAVTLFRLKNQHQSDGQEKGATP